MSIKNKYRGFLLATTGGIAAVSGAQAADLPVKAHSVAPVAPMASWEGWYIGLNAGIASHQSKFDPGYGGYSSGHQSGNGFIGGGQIGYNWQTGMYVLGLEADISGLTGKAAAGLYATGKGNALEAKISWLSTFRARAGWLVNPSTLIYATGGLAVGGVRNDFNFNGLNSSTGSATYAANTFKSAHKTKTGWTIGGGVETMVNTKWTLGLEGIYVDLGSSTSGTTPSGKTTTFNNTAIIARAKLNYKF